MQTLKKQPEYIRLQKIQNIAKKLLTYVSVCDIILSSQGAVSPRRFTLRPNTNNSLSAKNQKFSCRGDVMELAFTYLILVITAVLIISAKNNNNR